MVVYQFEEHGIIRPETAALWEAICAKDYAKHPGYPALDRAVERALQALDAFDYHAVPANGDAREMQLLGVATLLTKLTEVKEAIQDQLYTRCMENIAFRLAKLENKPRIDLDKDTFLAIAKELEASGGFAGLEAGHALYERLLATGMPEGITMEVMEYLDEAGRCERALNEVVQTVCHHIEHVSHVPMTTFDIIMSRAHQNRFAAQTPEPRVENVAPMEKGVVMQFPGSSIQH